MTRSTSEETLAWGSFQLIKGSSFKVNETPELPQLSGTATIGTEITSGEAQEAAESNFSVLVSFTFTVKLHLHVKLWLSYRCTHRKGPGKGRDTAGGTPGTVTEGRIPGSWAAPDAWVGPNDDKAAEWEDTEADGGISGSFCLEIVGRSRGCGLRVTGCLTGAGGSCCCCWICLL